MSGSLVYFETAIVAPEQARRLVFLTAGATNAADQALLDRLQQPTLEKPFTIAALRFLVDGMLAIDSVDR